MTKRAVEKGGWWFLKVLLPTPHPYIHPNALIPSPPPKKTQSNQVLDEPFDAGTAAPPQGMAWCGPDSLLLHWRSVGLLMVGPFGDYLHFPYHGESLALVPEVDCVRIGACVGGICVCGMCVYTQITMCTLSLSPPLPSPSLFHLPPAHNVQF